MIRSRITASADASRFARACEKHGFASLRLSPGAILAVEFVRGNEEVWFGLTRPQWFLLAVSPLLIRSVLRALRAPAPIHPETRSRWASG